MQKIMRPRRMLPIQLTLGALIFGLAPACPAVAADPLELDPTRIECRVANGYREAKRADVYYDGVRIFEGREMDEATANGDYVNCRSVVERAIALGRPVEMLRDQGADWNSDGFFTVSKNSSCN